MPNSIQYNTGTTISSLGVGDMHIGAGGDMGPTSTTGFFNGINPPSGGYTIYLNKGGDDGPSILCPASDAELIGISNQIAGGNDFTTINDCFTFFAGQSDKMVMHNPINTMVTDDLNLCFTADILPSYPRSGTTWYDISNESNSGDLENGAAFDSDGWIDFDGADDFVDGNGSPPLGNPCTIMALINCNSGGSGDGVIYGCAANGSDNWFEITGTTIRLFATQAADTNNFTVQGGTLICDGTRWYNVAMTLNGATAKIYLNGVEVNTTTRTFTIAGWTGAFDIGRRGNVSQRYFEGSIANVIGNSKLLSSTEILQNHYQAPIITDDLDFAVDAGNLASYIPSTTTTVSLKVVAGATTTGTLTNGVAFSSGDGGTWTFDGTDDFIAFGNPTALQYIYTDPFSLEVWCKPDATSGFKHLIGKSYSDYRLAQSGTGISFRLDSNNLTTQFGTLVAGEWTHIIATWEPSTSTAYVYQDGVLKGSVTDATVDWSSSPNNFQIGTSPGESYYFDGSIAIGRAYGKTLSLAEVQKNYNANVNRFN